MDGTLLDLHFDNYFWTLLVPQIYAKQNDISVEQSKTIIFGKMKNVIGQLEWYCLDYWQQQLQIDIRQLKYSVKHRISCRPLTIDFLTWLNDTNKHVILLTNAHPYSMDLKLQETALAPYFEHCISTHNLGYCKEQPQCWQELINRYAINKDSSMFIDDSQPVLNSAVTFGIASVIGITQPDSSLPANNLSNVITIADFDEIMLK